MGVCFSCVDQGSIEVIEQFGKFSRVAYPGFNCVWGICGMFASNAFYAITCVGETVGAKLNMRIQQLDVSVETKTLDNVFVNLVVSVQYQVNTCGCKDFYGF